MRHEIIRIGTDKAYSLTGCSWPFSAIIDHGPVEAIIDSPARNPQS